MLKKYKKMRKIGLFVLTFFLKFCYNYGMNLERKLKGDFNYTANIDKIKIDLQE